MTNENKSVTEYQTLENKLEVLQNLNQAYAKEYSNSMLRSEIMRNKLSVTESMKVLIHIDPKLTHLSRASKVYAKWLKEENVMDKSKKLKALGVIPADKQALYENMPSALEIRTRYKFENKPVEYQTLKVGVEYNKWLFKFMGSNNGKK